MAKLRNAIQKTCNGGTEPGHDEVSGEVTKALCDLGCDLLLSLLNHILKRRFPNT